MSERIQATQIEPHVLARSEPTAPPHPLEDGIGVDLAPLKFPSRCIINVGLVGGTGLKQKLNLQFIRIWAFEAAFPPTRRWFPLGDGLNDVRGYMNNNSPIEAHRDNHLAFSGVVDTAGQDRIFVQLGPTNNLTGGIIAYVISVIGVRGV